MVNDIAIGATAIMPRGAPVKKTPPHLIVLENVVGKVKTTERFISLDKPKSKNGFIEVRGFFSDKSEDEIIKDFNDILTNSSKELLLEMRSPLHRVVSMRILIF